MVSQLARLPEHKANEQDVPSIERLHPVLMEQLKNLMTALQVYYGPEADGQSVPEAVLEQQLQELIEALQAYDYDKADAITEKLESCDCSPELKAGIRTLREQEFQLEFEECMETASQMLGMIHSERE